MGKDKSKQQNRSLVIVPIIGLATIVLIVIVFVRRMRA
jgi:hypothetical protein